MEESTKSYSRYGPYEPTLIIHGGAGDIRRENLPPSLYAEYHSSLESYLKSTRAVLDNGGTAIEAACHAVSLLEDDPLFNCGRGSVFNTAGEIEMEASLAVTCVDPSRSYEGQAKGSAAVSLIRGTRHPILLAREVLRMADEDDGFGATAEMHGHLSGREVEEWGWHEKKLERKGKEWFWTKKRWEEHRRGLGKEVDFGSDVDVNNERGESAWLEDVSELPSQGTVGAVCMDSWGVIAVATSTGGLTNKRPGRIGDTPTVGAGFWAENWSEEHEQNGVRSYTGITMPTTTPVDRLARVVRSGLDFWIGDCIPQTQRLTNEHDTRRFEILSSDLPKMTRRQPLIFSTLQENLPTEHPIDYVNRAIAVSGTGNGDSFLRTVAARTAAAMARFSSLPLDQAVSAVAGKGGLLQRSARDRWKKTGEGQGGIIGIEITTLIPISAGGDLREASVVFDFNCGGMWRAYYAKDERGIEKPKVMVFREEYRIPG